MTRQLEHEHLHHDPSPMTGERFAQLREAMAQREESAPAVGDEAPEFELPVLDGKGATVRLSELRGKPVALIFGSYT
ncbi:MAG: redoxin domain-containing protein [Dehalococcoidia bacterium]